MAGTKEFNVDIDVTGGIKMNTPPNNTGVVLLYNSSSRSITTRTNAQFITDFNLALKSELPVYTSSLGITKVGNDFRPNYGTIANTIAQGNDSRINNGQTAFGWGNYALNTIAFNTTTVNPTNGYDGLDADTVLNSSRVFYALGTNAPNTAGFLDTTVFSNGAFQMSQGDQDNFYYRRRFGGTWRPWNQVASREWADNKFALVGSLGNYVPYTGATSNVNLGTRSITSTGGFIGNASTATKLASITTTFTGTYPLTVNVNGTIYSHIGLTYTGSTGELSANTFIGALSGNATTASTLATARTINGTSFNGSANIVTANWGTSRNITIGNTTKAVNGSANVSWSLAEIGINTGDYVYLISNQNIEGSKRFTDLGLRYAGINTSTSSGWHRIAKVSGRGYFEVGIHFTGGSFMPSSYILKGFLSWTVAANQNDIQLDSLGQGSYVRGARIVQDGDIYLEVYFPITPTYNINQTVSYLKGGEASVELIPMIPVSTITGTLWAESLPGWDNRSTDFTLVRAENFKTASYGTAQDWYNAYLATQNLNTDFITTNTTQTGLSGNKTTSGVWTLGEVRKAGQNDTQMLLAGGGHRPVSDFALVSQLPTVNNGALTLSTGTGLSGSANFTANQSGNSSFSVGIASTHKLPTVAEWNALPTTNTTYTNMILAEATAGTATTGRVISAKTLKDLAQAKGWDILEATTQGGVQMRHWNAIANKPSAMALGQGASATRINALAMMTGATADGIWSLALGVNAQTLKPRSSTIGPNSFNNAPDSSILGVGLVNNQYGATVLGTYNLPVTIEPNDDYVDSSPLLIVGNGKDSMFRSNSLVHFRDGSTKWSGRQYYNSTTRQESWFDDDNTLVDVKYVRENGGGGGGGLPHEPEIIPNTDWAYVGDTIYGIIESKDIGIVVYLATNGLWKEVHGTNVGALKYGLMYGFVVKPNSILIRGYVRDKTLNSTARGRTLRINGTTAVTVSLVTPSSVAREDVKLGTVISTTGIIYFNPEN